MTNWSEVKRSATGSVEAHEPSAKKKPPVDGVLVVAANVAVSPSGVTDAVTVTSGTSIVRSRVSPDPVARAQYEPPGATPSHVPETANVLDSTRRSMISSQRPATRRASSIVQSVAVVAVNV